MKKTILLVGALFAFMLCDAQVKTHSNYDVDGDGNVTVSDVTRTVNRVTEKLSDDRTVVDGESLNATLQEILSKLKSLDERIANLEKKNCTCSCSDGGETTDPYNGHEYVDLGLPSGLKWATCNIGANSPEEYGNFYAWGETSACGEVASAYPADFTGPKNESYLKSDEHEETKCYYDWRTYKYCQYKYNGVTEIALTKYCTDSFAGTVDNIEVLDLEDDAAHVNWGGDWRMPTQVELEELNTYCTWSCETMNDVKGCKVTGPNGNSIFLPASSGTYQNTSAYGSSCWYWSSSLYTSDNCAYLIRFDYEDKNVRVGGINRSMGLLVRAVCSKK